jgi:hypothetical protein
LSAAAAAVEPPVFVGRQSSIKVVVAVVIIVHVSYGGIEQIHPTLLRQFISR